MAERFCSLCGGTNPPEALECRECGAPLGPAAGGEEPAAPAETAPEPPIPSLKPKRGKGKKKRLVFALLGVAFLLLGAAALLLWRFWPEPPVFAAKSEEEAVSLGITQDRLAISYQPYNWANALVTREAVYEADSPENFGYFTAPSQDGRRWLYRRWGGTCVLYDRGELERLDCLDAVLSGDGEYLFSLTDPVEEDYGVWGGTITRARLKSGETVTVAQNGQYSLSAAGTDGSRLLYSRKEEDGTVVYRLWSEGDVERGISYSYDPILGDSQGAVLTQGTVWSGMDYQLWAIGWPQAGETDVALREVTLSQMRYDRTLSTLLYREEEEGWKLETREGVRPVAGLEGAEKMEPLCPSRSEELPTRLLDWVYAGDDGWLYYLSEEGEAARLAQVAYYLSDGAARTAAIDPRGETIYYLLGGEVFRLDHPRRGAASAVQLTRGAKAAFLYSDRELSHVYFRNTDGVLCCLPRRGEPVPISAGSVGEEVQVTAEGGCWFHPEEKGDPGTLVAGGPYLYSYAHPDGTVEETEVLADRLIPLGETGLVAIRVKDKTAQAWLLEEGGTALPLPQRKGPELPQNSEEERIRYGFGVGKILGEYDPGANAGD